MRLFGVKAKIDGLKKVFDTQRVRSNAITALLEYSGGATRIANQPVDVVLAVTDVCNLKCVMCPQGRGLVENPRHMPIEVVEAAINQIDSAARIILSGIGEPLLSPSFWKIIDRVKDRDDLFMRVNSNGWFIAPENAETLLDSGLSEVSVSLDAATAETYRKIRGGKLDRALAGIRNLVQAKRGRPGSKLEIYANITLMRENLAELEAFVDLSRDLGVDAVGVSELFPFGDTPDWVVEGDDWTFTYSEQMIAADPGKAAASIRAAYERSKTLGIPIIFLSETGRYLKMTGQDTEEIRRY